MLGLEGKVAPPSPYESKEPFQASLWSPINSFELNEPNKPNAPPVANALFVAQ